MAFNWNRKRIDADAEESRSRGQGGAFVGLKDGESMEGRFMPVEVPEAGKEAELYVRYGQHYLKDIETYFTCLDELVVAEYTPEDWKCSLCRLWKELRGSKDPDDQEEAKKYNVSIKFMSNFRLASGDMRIFRYSTKTQPKLIDLAFGTEYSDILDLKDGRDVRVSRKGTTIDTDYSITPLKKTYTIGEDALGDLHDIYAEIKVLEPKKMEEVLKGGEPDDSEYVTLRELMGGGKKAAAPAAKPAAKSVVARKAEAKPEPEPAVDTSATRKPTRQESKALAKFGDELGLEVDTDNLYQDIVDAIVTEAVGTLKKKLSVEMLDWLEANGCDVDGKTVEKDISGDEPDAKPAAKAAPEEMSEVERQIQKVRERRAAGKK